MAQFSVGANTIQQIANYVRQQVSASSIPVESMRARAEVGKTAPNILERNFKASQPNEKWVTDVTEFKVDGKKLYFSPVMDLFNGEILAYATSTRPLPNMVVRC